MSEMEGHRGFPFRMLKLKNSFNVLIQFYDDGLGLEVT